MPQVLVDTSIWIEFFRGRLNVNSRDILTHLIDMEQVVITDIILHELLVGAADQAGYDKLKKLLAPLHVLYLEPTLSPSLNHFGFELKKRGLLGRYTDVAIAFLAQHHAIPVFSLDKYFQELARKKIIEVFQAKGGPI